MSFGFLGDTLLLYAIRYKAGDTYMDTRSDTKLETHIWTGDPIQSWGHIYGQTIRYKAGDTYMDRRSDTKLGTHTWTRDPIQSFGLIHGQAIRYKARDTYMDVKIQYNFRTPAMYFQRTMQVYKSPLVGAEAMMK